MAANSLASEMTGTWPETILALQPDPVTIPVGIVHNGREKIHRLNQRQVIGDSINAGIVGSVQTDDDVFVGREHHSAQCLVQVPRRQLGGSAGTSYGFGQPDFFAIFHWYLSRCVH